MYFYIDNKLPWDDWILMTVPFMLTIIACVWAIRLAIKYKNIKRHMTKRINAVIIARVDIRYNYIYYFAGLDEYKGVTFVDWWLEVRAWHEIGETVPLLINEYNLEEFWFEEANENYVKYAVAMGGLAFLVLVLSVAVFRF